MDSSSVSRECYMISIRFQGNYLLTVIQTRTFLPSNEKSNIATLSTREFYAKQRTQPVFAQVRRNQA